MNDKKHAKGNSIDSWLDPLYLNELLTEEEKSIRKTTKEFCKSKLSPKVVEHNKKCFFDKKIYKEFGALGDNFDLQNSFVVFLIDFSSSVNNSFK
jgi:glutaryl-CoA dehydrogenase